MRRGKARGIGTPVRHRRWVGFLSRDSTNPNTTAPRPVGHRRATPPASSNSRRVTETTESSRHEYRQWRPHRCRRGSREEKSPSTGSTPSPCCSTNCGNKEGGSKYPVATLTIQNRRTQRVDLPRGPRRRKGAQRLGLEITIFRWRPRRGGAGRGRRQNNKTETDEKERRKSNPGPE